MESFALSVLVITDIANVLYVFLVTVDDYQITDDMDLLLLQYICIFYLMWVQQASTNYGIKMLHCSTD